MNISISVKSWFWKTAAIGLAAGLVVLVGLWHELRIHPNIALADVRLLGFGLDFLFGFGAAFWIVVGLFTCLKSEITGTPDLKVRVQEYPSESATAYEAFKKGDDMKMDTLHEEYFERQSPKQLSLDQPVTKH